LIVLASIPEVAVVLCLMLDMKKRWLVIVFRGFKNHQIVGKLDSNRSMRLIKTVVSELLYKGQLQPILNK
jgi:hypothetical protein